MARRYTNQSATNIDEFALVLTDNGNGGLLHGKTPVSGSVDYGTGEIRVDTNALKGRVNEPQYSNYQITQSASNTTGAIRYRETADVFISDASATVSAIKSGDTRDVTQTVDTGLQTYDLLNGKANPKACLLNTWVFDIGGIRTIERNGALYQNWDAQTGTGRVVGSLNSAGLLSVTAATLAGSTVKVLQGVYVNGTHDVKEFVGRTAAAPVKPMSFTAYADISADETLTGTAQRDETITGSLRGRIDSKTGFFSLSADKPIAPDSLRYNAVSQTTVPLDSSVIGINATRLPPDGRVPIFRAGGLVVIHNAHRQDLGSAHTAGSTVALARQKIDRLCIVDAAGKHVLAEQYEADLAAGSLKWANPLNLSEYAMPLTAVQTWEENNRVVETDISGSLKLQNPVSRDYPLDGTYVSSAVLAGDLQVLATEPFSQEAFTGVWQDTRIGNPILAQLNVADHPIRLISAGTITERWLLKFKNSTTFDVIGERVGLVASGDVYNDLAPLNPATGKPYFTIPAAAFGGGWAVQNCIRFNTRGTPTGIWILRAIQPTGKTEAQKDSFALCLRGNTVEKDA